MAERYQSGYLLESWKLTKPALTAFRMNDLECVTAAEWESDEQKL